MTTCLQLTGRLNSFYSFSIEYRNKQQTSSAWPFLQILTTPCLWSWKGFLIRCPFICLLLAPSLWCKSSSIEDNGRVTQWELIGAIFWCVICCPLWQGWDDTHERTSATGDSLCTNWQRITKAELLANWHHQQLLHIPLSMLDLLHNQTAMQHFTGEF